ncbi:YopX family protein [Robertmurraya sp. DFI.2.37]|uniref:YopX family protein n=1 Tax=Robertmurraya sp. DFI.2.37 TaxID=3031819 RepID=UPI0012482049|nr:YopX family protein [Robertmurraya sp. DFI.2.37]MDF1510699.1 YopX family protein [Robertmurraya sp. DFI.2.37]
MRIIKFRAWLPTNNRMYEFDENESLGDHFNRLIYGFGKFELMQYTGLKDKNGKEIYEGDILKVWQEDEYVPNRDSGGGIVDYDGKEGFLQIGKVGFQGCSFDYSTIKTIEGKHEEIHAPIDWINNYSVIGNIYENPELLEATE